MMDYLLQNNSKCIFSTIVGARRIAEVYAAEHKRIK
jgi:hypothetical protein